MPAIDAYVGGCVTLFFSSMLCSAAGVGGGGINVPILLLIFGYTFETCVTLSLFIVLGNGLAQNILNFGKAHPANKNLPLIFWELVIVLSPAQLGGSNVGNLLVFVLPKPFLYILALLVLSFASYMSFKKAMHRYHEEQALLHHENEQSEVSSRQSFSSIVEVERKESIVEELYESSLAAADLLTGGKVRQISEKKPVSLPIRVLVTMFLVWLCYTSIALGVSYVTKCSTNYIILTIVLYIPLLMGDVWGVFNTANLGEIYTENIAGGNDVEVNRLGPNKPRDRDTLSTTLITPTEYNQGTILRENALFMMTFTFCIGIICSLLGIGGGELLSPLMLTYHLIPQVTSATSAMLSLINTSALVIRTLSTESGIWDSGIILFFIGFLGGFIGRKVGLVISFEYNRSSFIIFALVVVLFLSSLYYVDQLATMNFDTTLDAFC